MGELGALGEPGGARRVEDRHVVVGIDVGGRKVGRRRRRIDDVAPAAGVGGQVAIGADADHVQRRPRSGGRRAPAAPARGARRRRSAPWAAESPRPYSSSGVVHQALTPDDGGAEDGHGPVADHPLRVVAHRQRDPVAAPDPVVVTQPVGERTHLGGDLGVGVSARPRRRGRACRPCSDASSHTARIVGGALVNTRIGMPRSRRRSWRRARSGGGQLGPGAWRCSITRADDGRRRPAKSTPERSYPAR